MRAISLQSSRRRGIVTGRLFVLQWHVTARCGEDCRHCYAKDSPDRSPQIRNELGLEDCMRVLSDFHGFLKANGLVGRINLTGGDPLLKDGLIDLVRAIRARGIKVGILGNPTLLNMDMACRLKEAGVFRYQLSIDGLKAIHDRLRGRNGHFEDTMRALGTLRDAGIPSVVMFTLSRENHKELPSVARLAAEMGVRVFDFARVVPQGRGRNLDMLSPKEYREVLLDVLDEYRTLEDEGARTYFGRKEALWTLLYKELGLFEPPRWDGKVHTGCSAGSKVLTILADGTVYPCRRMPIPVGKVPEEELSDILFNARANIELRDVSRFGKCRSCELMPYCRGCPAVAFGATNDPFAADPQCWKDTKEGSTVDMGRFTLKDHAFWARSMGTKPCAQCDGACGGCAHVCAACSEVCGSCSGCGD